MHRRLPVPDRLLLPPAPTGTGARRWSSLDFEQRRQLARRLAAPPRRVEPDRDLLDALARRRLATAWRLRMVSVVLGWLVLMTVWGFGRTQSGEAIDGWLAAGLVLGLAAGAIHWRAMARRLATVRRHVGDVRPPSPRGA